MLNIVFDENLLRFLSESGSESSSEDEEESEPQLKYERLSADLKAILKKDVASCLAVHSRFCQSHEYHIQH